MEHVYIFTSSLPYEILFLYADKLSMNAIIYLRIWGNFQYSFFSARLLIYQVDLVHFTILIFLFHSHCHCGYRNETSPCFHTVIFLSHLDGCFMERKRHGKLKILFTKTDQPCLKIKETVFRLEDESLT